MNRKGLIILLIAAFAAFIYFLRLVFTGRLILPQYFTVGPLEIHYYGVFIAAAVIAAFALASRRAPRYGLEREQAENLMLWLIVGGFVGARLYHVWSSWSYYAAHPIDIFKIWNGGLSIYGVLIGGLATLVIASKILNLKFSILNLLDWLAPSLVLGQVIGRFGNFFNYELYGYPTNLFWKMFVPPQFRIEPYTNQNFFHPLFLYEALGNTAILIFLLWYSKTYSPLPNPPPRGGRGSNSGTLFFWYLLLYNMLRFLLEFLRVDSTWKFGVRINACVSLGLAIIALAALAFQSFRHHEQQNT